MNSNEASQAKGLGSVSIVRGKAWVSPLEGMEGEKNKSRALEKASREEEWSSNERETERGVQGCIQTQKLSPWKSEHRLPQG